MVRYLIEFCPTFCSNLACIFNPKSTSKSILIVFSIYARFVLKIVDNFAVSWLPPSPHFGAPVEAKLPFLFLFRFSCIRHFLDRLSLHLGSVLALILAQIELLFPPKLVLKFCSNSDQFLVTCWVPFGCNLGPVWQPLEGFGVLWGDSGRSRRGLAAASWARRFLKDPKKRFWTIQAPFWKVWEPNWGGSGTILRGFEDKF